MVHSDGYSDVYGCKVSQFTLRFRFRLRAKGLVCRF